MTTLIDSDEHFSQIKKELEVDPKNQTNYTLEQGRLLHKGRLVLPRGSDLTPRILHEFHAGIIGGHSGFLRTYRRIIVDLYWPSMKNDRCKFVENFEVYQRNKVQSLSPASLLQPSPIPEQIWEDISMDLIKGLPKSQGFSVILIVVDKLTKYVHFIPLKHLFSASTVVAVFIKELVRLHGILRSIISGRDKILYGTSTPRDFFSIKTYYLHLTKIEGLGEKFPSRLIWKVKMTLRMIFFGIGSTMGAYPNFGQAGRKNLGK